MYHLKHADTDISGSMSFFSMSRMPHTGEFPKIASAAWKFDIPHTIALLFIHRSFFVKSLLGTPENPLQSQYASSFQAAYDAACHIGQQIHDQYARLSSLCVYSWNAWGAGFSAAVRALPLGSNVPRLTRKALSRWCSA